MENSDNKKLDYFKALLDYIKDSVDIQLETKPSVKSIIDGKMIENGIFTIKYTKISEPNNSLTK